MFTTTRPRFQNWLVRLQWIEYRLADKVWLFNKRLANILVVALIAILGWTLNPVGVAFAIGSYYATAALYRAKRRNLSGSFVWWNNLLLVALLSCLDWIVGGQWTTPVAFITGIIVAWLRHRVHCFPWKPPGSGAAEAALRREAA